MSIEILMPAVMPQMTEGTVVRWAKAEGETFKAGEVLFEVETEKTVTEIEAKHDGVLERILVPAGTSGVQIDTVIGLLRA